MTPLGKNSDASFPSNAATRSSSRRMVGSPSRSSSPTSAAAIAARIAGVGFVTVSLRRSMVMWGIWHSPYSPRYQGFLVTTGTLTCVFLVPTTGLSTMIVSFLVPTTGVLIVSVLVVTVGGALDDDIAVLRAATCAQERERADEQQSLFLH